MAFQMTRDVLNKGMDWEQWIAGMTINKEQFRANYDAVQISPADAEHFSNLSEPVDLFCMVADWCGDVLANFPMVGKLANTTGGKLRLHIFLLDDNEELAKNYLAPDGRPHVPTYVLFDRNLNQLGKFIERPDFITDAMQGWKKDFVASHPDLPGAASPTSDMPYDTRQAWRAYTRERRNALREQEQETIFNVFRDSIQHVQDATGHMPISA